MGSASCPSAHRLLVTTDGGGSNGSRNRLWKWELQNLADETGLRISVCHFPPGTSKWNKIEHRMFCHITENWRGRPLLSVGVVVNLIGHTTTRSGLTIRSELDDNSYPTGQRVTAQQMESISLKRDKLNLLKRVWVGAASVQCLRSTETASRRGRRRSESRTRAAQSLAACC